MPPRKTISGKLSEAIDMMKAQRYAPALKILEKLHEAASKKDTKSENKVKRKPSTYNKFIKDNYAAIKAKNPNVAPKDMLKVIADEWRSRSGDEPKIKSAAKKSSAKKPAAKKASVKKASAKKSSSA